MTMILVSTGALLVLAGILGGGFEVQKIQIPKLGGVARAVATVIGLLFVIVPLGLENSEASPKESQHQQQPARLVAFTIHDALGESQVSEQVQILIDGKHMGALSVNRDYPSASLTVTVPAEGKYSYGLEAHAVFNINGRQKEYVGAGQGMIEVMDGKAYMLQGAPSGETWLAHLVEVAK